MTRSDAGIAGIWSYASELFFCGDGSDLLFIHIDFRISYGSGNGRAVGAVDRASLTTELQLPKLNFQVLRRTIATLAQTKGGVKDVQRVLGHSKADTAVNVYMQPIEASLKQTLEGRGGGSVVKFRECLVRFGTVRIWDGAQVLESKQQARSSVG